MTSGDGDDNEYTGPIEVGHPNRNAFKIVRVGEFIPVPFPQTLYDWRLYDVAADINLDAPLFLLSAGYSEPDPDAGPWSFTGVDAGSASGALPVEFLYFQGKSQHDAIQLEWATSSESNNKGFEVQHSQDARTWKALDFVEGVGTTVQTQRYGYWHESPANGYNYYRLKQLDYDGAFEFSDIVEVRSKKKENIRAYPNPVREQVNIILPATNNGAETVEVRWIDVLGRSLQQQMPAATDGQQLVLPVPTDLPNGLYLLQLRIGQEIYQTSIQKQR